LPEAQVDRFLYKLEMTYPTFDEEIEILNRNITLSRFEDFKLKSVLSPSEIIRAQKYVKQIYTDSKIKSYIIRIIDATRNPSKYEIELGKYLEFGASPRSSIAIFIASKAHALLKGRSFVVPQDIKDVAYSVLRHRMVLNYEGQAEEINVNTIIKEILEKVSIY
jgi:MoxR-like ATPase